MIRTRKTYISCNELPLFNFIKLSVIGDMEYLYKEKARPWMKPADLTEIWDKIADEYKVLIKDKKSSHVLTLLKDITFMNNQLMLIQLSVNFLHKYYEPGICDLLRRLGFQYAFKDDESLYKDLKLVVSSAKRILVDKIAAEKELESIPSDGKAATENDYIALIGQMSKYMNFKIDPKNTTIAEFVSYIQMNNLEFKPKADA